MTLLQTGIVLVLTIGLYSIARRDNANKVLRLVYAAQNADRHRA